MFWSVGPDVRPVFVQRIDLRLVDHRNVAIVRVMRRIVLVVGFRRVESFKRNHLGRERRSIDLRGAELFDVGAGDLLLFVAEKNRRAALRSGVRALPSFCVGSCATEK
jgi:hypothetical protein